MVKLAACQCSNPAGGYIEIIYSVPDGQPEKPERNQKTTGKDSRKRLFSIVFGLLEEFARKKRHAQFAVQRALFQALLERWESPVHMRVTSNIFVVTARLRASIPPIYCLLDIFFEDAENEQWQATVFPLLSYKIGVLPSLKNP